MAELTAYDARQLLWADFDAGKLYWKTRERRWFASDGGFKMWNTRYAGREAFTCLDNKGYRVGKIFYAHYLAHRVLWLIEKGEWPEDQIDHINGDTIDNRLCNLRAVSRHENMRNIKKYANNTSGVMGVCQDKKSGKWRGYISVNGVNNHLGFFDNIEDAVAVRKAAEIKYDFHENHGRG